MRNLSVRYALELGWDEIGDIVSGEIEDILGLRVHCKVNVVEDSLWDVTFIDYRLPLSRLCQILQATQATQGEWEDALPGEGEADVGGIGTLLAEKLVGQRLNLTWEHHLITTDSLWLVGVTSKQGAINGIELSFLSESLRTAADMVASLQQGEWFNPPQQEPRRKNQVDTSAGATGQRTFR